MNLTNKIKSVVAIIAPLAGHLHIHFCGTKLQGNDDWFYVKPTTDSVGSTLREKAINQAIQMLLDHDVAKFVEGFEITREEGSSCDVRFDYIPVEPTVGVTEAEPTHPAEPTLRIPCQVVDEVVSRPTGDSFIRSAVFYDYSQVTGLSDLTIYSPTLGFNKVTAGYVDDECGAVQEPEARRFLDMVEYDFNHTSDRNNCQKIQLCLVNYLSDCDRWWRDSINSPAVEA